MHVLSTSILVPPTDDELLAPLHALGATLEFSPFVGKRAPGELATLLRHTDAMLASTDPMTAEALDQAPRLKLIARVGVGYDTVDVAAARQRGIAVTVTPGANEHAVADYTLASMLALLRRVVSNHITTAAGGWERRPGSDLSGKTVGIVGLGRIGKLVARRLSGFDVRLLAHDVYQDATFAEQYGVQYIALDDLLAAADIVTFHVLLTAQTRHLLDAGRLTLLKPSAVVVNTCRGPVIDELALAAALHAGRLAGAALDVFEEEPPHGSPILAAPNVLLSPHMAGITRESSRRMAAMAIAEVTRSLQGIPPLHPVA
ncbi:MAG TPA: phosphoglycerate dehydrogenase [Chloroflexota bacterium]|jgi:D-3-phosphoglycerate dehydrogenase|nr:phosphoglycerate dehydrogenase [Chloroflexota bacterium]